MLSLFILSALVTAITGAPTEETFIPVSTATLAPVMSIREIISAFCPDSLSPKGDSNSNIPTGSVLCIICPSTRRKPPEEPSAALPSSEALPETPLEALPEPPSNRPSRISPKRFKGSYGMVLAVKLPLNICRERLAASIRLSTKPGTARSESMRS